MIRPLLLLVTIAATTACEPPCLRGHDEPVWIAQVCYDMPVLIGDVTVMFPLCDAAHSGTQFVCDQYQAEKP